MTPFWSDDHLTVHIGDCRAVMAEMPAESVHCVVTSPPYWGLRDYGTATWDGGHADCDHAPRMGVSRTSTLGGGEPDGSPRDRPVIVCRCGARRIDAQLGLEATPEAYVAAMVAVFREVRRVLRDDGTLWLNLGDSYAGSGRGAWNVSDEVKDAAGVKEVYRPKVRPVGDSPRDNAVTKGAGDERTPNGLKPKDLVGIPWRVAFALQADGWYLRSDIIWSKPNPMPESVTDRPTKAHEYLFLLTKSARYHYDAEAVREVAQSGPSDLRKMAEGKERIGGLVKEQTDPLLKASALTNIGRKRSVGGRPLGPHGGAAPDSDRQTAGARMGRGAGWRDDPSTTPVGRNIRSVWTIATQPYPGAHFATFPEKLVEPCIKAGCPSDGVVLDPFAGSGTVGRVANRLGRRAVLIDLSADYIDQAMLRNAQAPLGLVG